MNRSHLVVFLAGAGMAMAVGAAPALAALAAAPVVAVSSPRVSINPLAFRVGTSIDAAAAGDGSGCTGYQAAVPMMLSWTGAAGSAPIVNYDLSRFNATSPPEPLPTHPGGSGGSLALTGSNYESECGGNVHSYSYLVSARTGTQGTPGTDVAAAWSPYAGMSVWQENGAGPNSAIAATRTGRWTNGSCTCFNWGRDAWTTQAGATMRYRVSTTKAAQDIAIVATTAPERGKLTISVDGGAAQTVDTYASAVAYRVVVWQSLVGPGTHTVTLTDLATPTRPRIDIDSVLLSGT